MKNKWSILSLLAAIWCFSGCVSYEYEGKCEPPVKAADEIKVFTDSALVPRRYSVLGKAMVSGNSRDVSRDRLIARLRSGAHEVGANAILIVEQQVVTVNEDSARTPFTTAFDYDDSSQNWSQLQRDVDQNFTNSNRYRNSNDPGASRRIIRAEFLRYLEK